MSFITCIQGANILRLFHLVYIMRSTYSYSQEHLCGVGSKENDGALDGESHVACPFSEMSKSQISLIYVTCSCRNSVIVMSYVTIFKALSHVRKVFIELL